MVTENIKELPPPRVTNHSVHLMVAVWATWGTRLCLPWRSWGDSTFWRQNRVSVFWPDGRSNNSGLLVNRLQPHLTENLLWFSSHTEADKRRRFSSGHVKMMITSALSDVSKRPSRNQSTEGNQYLLPERRQGERGRRRSWRRGAPLVWQPSNTLTEHWQRSNKPGGSLHSFAFCSVFKVWLSQDPLRLGRLQPKSSRLLVHFQLKTCRIQFSKPPPALHSSTAISPSSPLSISVSCSSNFKSLFFMQLFDRWEVEHTCTLPSSSPSMVGL